MIRRLVMLMAVALLASVAFLGWRICESRLYEVKGLEFHVVHSLQSLRRTGTAYPDPAQPPHLLTQYGPLYYRLVSAQAPQGLDPIDLITAGRRVSGFLSLALLAVLGGLGLRLGLGWTLLLPTLALALAEVAPWIFLCRPDALTLLCFMAAVGSFMRAVPGDVGRGGPWPALAAGVWSGLALLSKQSAIMLLPLFPVLGWWGGRRAFVPAVAGCVAVLGSAPWVAGAPWGQLLTQLMLGMNNGTSLIEALHRAYEPASHVFPLHAAALVVAWGVLRDHRTRLAQSMLATAYIAAFVLAAISALKVGSAWHYFNESVVCAFLLVGWKLTDLSKTGRMTSSLWALLILSVMAHGSFTALRRHNMYYQALPQVFRLTPEVARYVEKVMASGSDDLAFTPDRELPLWVPGCFVFPQPYFAEVLHEVNPDPGSWLRQDVASGRLRWLVLPEDTQPSAWLGETFEGFEFEASVPPFDIWRRR